MAAAAPDWDAWPLIGREDELGRLTAALRRTRAPGAVITGSAGVGKTRLAAECRSLAEDEGNATAQVLASRAASSIPLGAFASLLPADVLERGAGAEALRRAVEALTSDLDGRLVLTVDDAHLLDDVSAALLHALVATGRVFAVLTVRTGEGASDAAAAEVLRGDVEWIDLDELDRVASDRLVLRVLDGAVDGAVLQQCHELSRGNPLHLRELLRDNVESGHLHDRDRIWRLEAPMRSPASLASLLEARLAERTEEERRAVELVALGEPLALDHLVRLADAACVELLERDGLLTVVGAWPRPSVRLAHPLYGDVVRAEMPALRTMRLHQLLADSLEALGTVTPEDAVRLAAWRLDGGGEVDEELMLAAARRAFSTGDGDLAERLARSALEAGGGPRARVLLAEVLVDRGRLDEAEALVTGLELGSGALAVQAALVRAQGLYRAHASREDAEAVLAAAAALDEDAGAAVAVAQHAVFEMLAGELAAAVERVRPHLEGEPKVVAHASMAAAPALAVMGRCREAVDVAARGRQAHEALPPEERDGALGLHLAARALALIESGLLAEAEEAASFGYNGALAARADAERAWFALLLGRTMLVGGRLATATRLFREGNAIFAGIGQPGLQRWCLAGCVIAAAMSDDAPAATAARDDLAGVVHMPTLLMESEVDRAHAWHALVQGDTVSARDGLHAAAARARAMGAAVLEAGALHDLVRLGGGTEVVGRLGEVAADTDSALVAARALHAEAVTALDPGALSEAADAFEHCGTILEAAEAAAEAALALRRRGAPREANRLAGRSRALAARCEGARTPALLLAGDAAARLTPRERELATLAAAGRTNREIADQLSISLRTVENHLHHCFEKLGVSRRQDLGGALADE